LIPHADLELPRIRQNYTFLIDRSNSIQKDRLTATKMAVQKAIEELYPDDTFNIIAFDSKVEKLSPVSLSPNPASIASAQNFLEKIQLGSFFSAGDLCKPLLQTVPGRVQNDELYTAILLTDGESLSKKNIQRSLFLDWTSYNSGRVSLFAVGMNSDPHLSTLDAAAAFNKGKLIYSPSQRGLKRKLLKLMKTIGNPIAKCLNCKAISRSPKGKIELFPNSQQLPHLYLDQPYVILGAADSLDDFILFAQGRLKNRWINIKKSISFLNAKKGGSSLKAEWALQQAYNLYERYVIDGDSTHLAEAGKLLEPTDYQVAFQ
jgi:Ca-activated chloride channel homolog